MKKLFFALTLAFVAFIFIKLDVVRAEYGTGDGQFASPNGIYVATDGKIYVADSGNIRVQIFNNAQEFIMKFSNTGIEDSPFLANSIAVDTSGNIYISGDNTVLVYNSDGVFQRKFGSVGNGNGQFSGNYQINLDAQGNIYVADRDNNRIQKFSNNGTFLMKIGSFGTGNGQFNSPSGIAVDNSGNIYVSDTGNSRIQKFNSNGVFQLKFGSSGSEDGQLSYPLGIATDAVGNIYVADNGNQRIQAFYNSGYFQKKLSTIGPCGVSVDSIGNVYVAECGNDAIRVISSTMVLPPTTLTNVYFTFGRLRYGRYASPSALRSGDAIYLKNYDPKKIQLLAISLYDYNKKGNQCYTRAWKTSTSMSMKTCGLLPNKNKYAFIFTFKDITTGVQIKKYFVVNTISSSTVTL